MISRKSKYALRAIFELSLRNSEKPVKIHEIAASQGIPQRFLETILAELKHAGFLESRRGNDGGYILAKSSDNITVGEVISFLEGDLSDSNLKSKDDLTRVGNSAFKNLWDEVSAAVSEVYNKTSFADLVRFELDYRIRYVPNYAI
jgi:Rrf2 family cysteine metabolism transcriptional repressor